VILLSTPTLTAITCDYELGLILPAFTPPVVPNCRAVIDFRHTGRKVLVRARVSLDSMDGDAPKPQVTERVDYDTGAPISDAVMDALLESIGRDRQWLDTQLNLGYEGPLS
jgi:hypothetical protein